MNVCLLNAVKKWKIFLKTLSVETLEFLDRLHIKTFIFYVYYVFFLWKKWLDCIIISRIRTNLLNKFKTIDCDIKSKISRVTFPMQFFFPPPNYDAHHSRNISLRIKGSVKAFSVCPSGWRHYSFSFRQSSEEDYCSRCK